MPKHTSGPWFAEKCESSNKWTIHDESQSLAYSVTTGLGMTREMHEANAHLVAAAPDLLAACKEAMKVVDEAYEATGFIRVAKTSHQRLMIEAAIAKAEGGPR